MSHPRGRSLPRRALVLLSLAALGAGVAVVLLRTPRSARDAGGWATGQRLEGEEDLRLGPLLPARLPSPGPSDPGRDIIPGAFVLQLRDGAGRPERSRGAWATGDGALDGALEDIAPGGGRALSAAAGSRAGLERALVFESDRSEDEVLDALGGLEAVAWVEPLVRFRAAGAPDDPRFVYQWNLKGLDAPAAWERSRGEGVVVAVLDTGVSQELDGLSELLPGYDFVDGDEDPSDGAWHGSHVAGVIAQRTDNAEGVASLAPGASILPARVLGEAGGDSVALAEAITWAVDSGAQVINLSLGSDTYAEVVALACDYAYQHGVLVVAASGNDAYEGFVQFPASLETVLAVGAHDGRGEVPTYSNRGVELDLVAPGGDLARDDDDDGIADGIFQAVPLEDGWTYMAAEGTSEAAPHVSAAAALLIAAGVTGVEDLWDALLISAEDGGTPGHDSVYGYGRLDVNAALAFEPGSAERPPRSTQPEYSSEGGCQ
jgi:subtilisin family serine protease